MFREFSVAFELQILLYMKHKLIFCCEAFWKRWIYFDLKIVKFTNVIQYGATKKNWETENVVFFYIGQVFVFWSTLTASFRQHLKLFSKPFPKPCGRTEHEPTRRYQTPKLTCPSTTSTVNAAQLISHRLHMHERFIEHDEFIQFNLGLHVKA